MTSAIAAAFDRLGLAPTRDARSIKRAYAVALKATDQASEREAFEQLRQAYERALAWAAAASGDAFGHGEDELQDSRHRRPHREPDTPEPDTAELGVPGPDDAGGALHQWVERLRQATPGTATALIDAALADPRLMHLDSRAALEARIAELLHHDPSGRVLLFDAAVRRFHWADDGVPSAASAAAAAWISRVLRQDLLWRSQANTAKARQQQALQRVADTACPAPDAQRTLAGVLETMARDFPDWLALHLEPAGRAHLPAWRLSPARPAAVEPDGGPADRREGAYRRALRWSGARLKRAVAGSRPVPPAGLRPARPRKATHSLMWLFVLVGMAVALSIAANHLRHLLAAPTAAVAPSTVASPAAAPSLAYEFTGALTHDSCSGTEGFVHRSNWLSIDDPDAIALLATRAMRCQDKGLWSRPQDRLMACLRTERAAALGMGRPEDPRHCAELDRKQDTDARPSGRVPA